MALTLGQLLAELRERNNDLSMSVQVSGYGDIEDIEFTDDGIILLVGELNEQIPETN